MLNLAVIMQVWWLCNNRFVKNRRVKWLGWVVLQQVEYELATEDNAAGMQDCGGHKWEAEHISDSLCKGGFPLDLSCKCYISGTKQFGGKDLNDFINSLQSWPYCSR